MWDHAQIIQFLLTWSDALRSIIECHNVRPWWTLLFWYHATLLNDLSYVHTWIMPVSGDRETRDFRIINLSCDSICILISSFRQSVYDIPHATSLKRDHTIITQLYVYSKTYICMVYIERSPIIEYS